MKIVSDIIDFMFPRYCPICKERMSQDEQYICFNCLSDLPRTNAHLIDENPIEKLYWTHLPIERATSFFFYDSLESRQTIYFTKYFNDPNIGKTIASVMAEELQETDFFAGMDMIIPVPLHPKRQRSRGYNQCDYICKGLSQHTGRPVLEGVAERVVNNPTQTHLDPAQRKDNVKDIFRLVNPARIENKHVLLVDDVITTGSTLLSFAEEIAKAKDVSISIFSLAFAGQMIRTNLP
jgi:ComF family protein